MPLSHYRVTRKTPAGYYLAFIIGMSLILLAAVSFRNHIPPPAQSAADTLSLTP